MKKALTDQRYVGIFAAILFAAAFLGISIFVHEHTRIISNPTHWYLFSSILRAVFGMAILFFVRKIYGKTPKQALGFHNTKVALVSAAGFLIFFVYYLFDYAAGFNTIVGLSAGLLVSKVLLQQITTGFYEELNYRLLILEGYFYGKPSVGRKLAYALISFVAFGLIHVITGWSTYGFLHTGAVGFAFAVIYLNSGNMMLPMLLHFVYDIFANLADYVEWNQSLLFVAVNSVFEIMLAIMFLVSFLLLFRKDQKPKAETSNLLV